MDTICDLLLLLNILCYENTIVLSQSIYCIVSMYNNVVFVRERAGDRGKLTTIGPNI